MLEDGTRVGNGEADNVGLRWHSNVGNCERFNVEIGNCGRSGQGEGCQESGGSDLVEHDDGRL